MSQDLTTIVIRRQIGQSVNIGPDVLLTVTRIKGREAQISIQAPKGMQVLRTEKLMNVVNRNKPK